MPSSACGPDSKESPTDFRGSLWGFVLVLDLMLLPVYGGGNTDIFAEDPVELGKAVEAAGGGDFRDGCVGIDQQGLYVADPGHLNVIRYGEACNLLEPMGQVAGTQVVGPGKKLQRQIVGIVGMDVAGNGVDLLLQLRQHRFIGIDIAVLIQVQQDQKFDELLMDDQIAHGVVFGRELVNVIQLATEPLLQLRIETEYGGLLTENTHKLLVFVGQSGDVGGNVELDDQPLAGPPVRVLGLVEPVRADAHNIKGLNFVGDTLDKMDCVGTQEDAQLIKRMKMLELHVDRRIADIVVEVVKNGIIFLVYMNGVLVLIQQVVVQNHGADLLTAPEFRCNHNVAYYGMNINRISQIWGVMKVR